VTVRRSALVAAVVAAAVAGWSGLAGAQDSPDTTAPVDTVAPAPTVPPVGPSTTFPWCAPWAATLPAWPEWLPPCAELGATKSVNDPSVTVPEGSSAGQASGGGGGSATVQPPAPKEVDPEQPKKAPGPPPGGWPVRSIVFPTVGPVTYNDDFGACRDGCSRFHIGNDIIGTRMQPLVAAADGWVTHLVLNHVTAGWGLVITDLDGWDYRYYHVNNDEPHTDDGTSPVIWRLAPGIEVGSRVRAGQLIAYMGDSGNSEFSVPHLHFEIHQPDGTAVDPYDSLRLAEDAARCYWLPGLAELPDLLPPTDSTARVVDIATKTGEGTFTISADGTVFLQGDAKTVGWSHHREGLTCPASTVTPASEPVPALAE
jgi:hypothetical protein